MGTKLQAVISIWICLLLSQCFSQDKGEEDFQGVTVTGRESAPTYGKPCFPGTQKLAIGLNLSVFHLEAGLTFFFFFQIKLTAGECFTCLTGSYWFIFCSGLGQEFLHPAGRGRP